MKESELIKLARVNLGEPEINTVLEALEAFYGHGFTDGNSGDVETFGHFYRFHRWIVWTDNQGFHEVDTFATEAKAIAHFESLDREYAATFGTGECF